MAKAENVAFEAALASLQEEYDAAQRSSDRWHPPAPFRGLPCRVLSLTEGQTVDKKSGKTYNYVYPTYMVLEGDYANETWDGEWGKDLNEYGRRDMCALYQKCAIELTGTIQDDRKAAFANIAAGLDVLVDGWEKADKKTGIAYFHSKITQATRAGDEAPSVAPEAA